MTLIFDNPRRKRRSSLPPPPPILPLADPAFRSKTPAKGIRLRIRRFFRTRIPRLLLFVFVLVNILEVVRIKRHITHPRAAAAPNGQPAAPRRKERVYIASMHWNNGPILKKHWNDAVVGLAEALGPENVFVSVYESGSWDNSKAVLAELDRRLESRGVPRNITLSRTTHKDEITKVPEGEGWVDTPRGKRELRRIPYLAGLRNLTLRDLLDLHRRGITFDKVLFLNDVVFTTQDVLNLLDTNGGSYAAACSLDFSNPPNYYDTFALRDSDGQTHLMQQWPYFRSSLSRQGMIENWPAIPVTSCWNGIVAMPAAPFVSATTALSFRGIPDSLAALHLEASECCLIHADNPLSAELGVFLNPRVRVAYNTEAYEATHPGGSWLSSWQILQGLWSSRVRRWLYRTETRDWIVKRRLKQWEAESYREPGTFCLINEMQVLVENGWAHV